MNILLVVLIIVLMQSKERKVKINRIWLNSGFVVLCNNPVHYSYGTNNFAARTTVCCNAWNWLRSRDYTGKSFNISI